MLPVLSPVITEIINMSLSNGYFPEPLKHALVVPLLKKPSLDPEDVSNYRPVSNLSFLSKTIERVVSITLAGHLEQHQLLPKRQSASRAGYSTETALLEVTNGILRTIDNGDACALLLLDMSAAFDTVDHGILLSRLHHRCGVTGTALQWFTSYLTNRSQSVIIEGVTSAPSILQHGVPQGSSLGPQLFTSYVSPLPDVVAHHPDVDEHGFSDDQQLRIRLKMGGGQQAVDVSALSPCVEELRGCLIANKLKENPGKRELLIVTSRARGHALLQEDHVIAGQPIKPSKSVRSLGVILDQHLTMEGQVEAVCKSAYYYLRLIRRVRHCLDLDSTKLRIHGLVVSRLDYCNSLLYGLPEVQLRKLQRVQNAAARLVLDQRSTTSSQAALRKLHWLPISQRVEFKLAVLAHKCFHGSAPSYLIDLVPRLRPGRDGLRSASSKLLAVPRVNLETYGRRAFSVAAPTIWNGLTEVLRNIEPLNTFRAKVKTHLFRCSF